MIINGKLLAGGFLLLGGYLLLQIAWPLLSFKLWENAFNLNSVSLISPQKGSEVKGISIQSWDNFPSFISTLKRLTPAPYEKFKLVITALKVNNEVLVDSNDLNKGLAHLPGSALPGEKGNAFISGHSALPLNFLPGQKAMFSNLQDLKKGDEIKVVVGGSQFVYKVVNIKIVDPKDLSVILPPDEMGRYISLMTCVPPGLNTKRLVVLGELD